MHTALNDLWASSTVVLAIYREKNVELNRAHTLVPHYFCILMINDIGGARYGLSARKLWIRMPGLIEYIWRRGCVSQYHCRILVEDEQKKRSYQFSRPVQYKYYDWWAKHEKKTTEENSERYHYQSDYHLWRARRLFRNVDELVLKHNSTSRYFTSFYSCRSRFLNVFTWHIYHLKLGVINRDRHFRNPLDMMQMSILRAVNPIPLAVERGVLLSERRIGLTYRAVITAERVYLEKCGSKVIGRRELWYCWQVITHFVWLHISFNDICIFEMLVDCMRCSFQPRVE